MDRIGHQREAVGEISAEQFRRAVEHDRDENNFQPSLVGRDQMAPVVMAVAVGVHKRTREQPRVIQSYWMSEVTGTGARRSRPLRNFSSTTKPHPTTSPPILRTRRTAACAVPPVASRSSTMSTRASRTTPSSCICNSAEPYSSSYDSPTKLYGSLPGLRAIASPTPSRYAIGAPKMKPRDSM